MHFISLSLPSDLKAVLSFYLGSSYSSTRWNEPRQSFKTIHNGNIFCLFNAPKCFSGSWDFNVPKKSYRRGVRQYWHDHLMLHMYNNNHMSSDPRCDGPEGCDHSDDQRWRGSDQQFIQLKTALRHHKSPRGENQTENFEIKSFRTKVSLCVLLCNERND